MLTKPDWIFENCWCDYCKHRINKLKANNELVVVSDGLEKYYVFDSWDCAIACCEKHRLSEGCGLHDAEAVAILESLVKKKPNWHISRTSIKILELTVSKLQQKEVVK